MDSNLFLRQLNSYQVNNYFVVDMLWNIFLIVVPIVLYLLIKRWWYYVRGGLGNRILILILFVLWLFFLPNTAYVMTDVRHLVDYCPANEFDVCPANSWMPIFFFAYSLLGWLSFVWLLRAFTALINSHMNKIAALFFLLLSIPLTALGVLLGLLDRMNSWDIVTSPYRIYRAAVQYFIDPRLFKIFLVYSLILFFLYGLGWLFFNKKSN